jgi:hypothetical protein
MIETAAMHGILLQQLDYTRSLLTQGTFDVIIHKLRPNPGMPPQSPPTCTVRKQHQVLLLGAGTSHTSPAGTGQSGTPSHILAAAAKLLQLVGLQHELCVQPVRGGRGQL